MKILKTIKAKHKFYLIKEVLLPKLCAGFLILQFN